MSTHVPILEVIKSLCLQEGDILQRKKGRYLNYASEVWKDLNLQTVREATRQFFTINKLTNTITLPCPFLELSGVSVIDYCGIAHPIYRNDKVRDDLVEVGAAKDCACECSGTLCNLIKGYEAIIEETEELMPDSSTQTFTSITRKAYDASGFYYEEKTFPVRQYESGVWTDTILTTERIELCKVEVDANGCITDCDDNVEKVCTCDGQWDKFCTNKDALPEGSYLKHCTGRFDFYYTETGKCWSCYDKWGNFKNIYNISEDGKRLIFPHNFGWKRVMVRYYENTNLRDIRVPFKAVKAFKAGLKQWDTEFKDKVPMGLKASYQGQYSRLKFATLLDLNKYRIAELKQIFTPHIYFP